MSSGLIVDVKRFAVHDGPGIRTTVFLKGCPLRCRWCHNPESISGTPELGFLEARCSGCGDCARICSCHSVVGGGHTIDRSGCTGCGGCVRECLRGALELHGRRISVEECAGIVLEDRDFYLRSGGGVTVSGGEPLLQAEFCRELLTKLKAGGVHTAIDTSGDVPWAAFEAVLPAADLFLYDFKHADPEAHRRLTGRDNQRILENLKRLDGSGKAIEVRMVMIPGLNMASADLEAAGKFLGRLKHLSGVRLLPYHALARAKYRSIGRPDTMPDAPPPTAAELAAAKTILAGYSPA